MIRWYRRRRTARLTKLLTAQVRAGVLSVNQARAQLGLEPWSCL